MENRNRNGLEEAPSRLYRHGRGGGTRLDTSTAFVLLGLLVLSIGPAHVSASAVKFASAPGSGIAFDYEPSSFALFSNNVGAAFRSTSGLTMSTESVRVDPNGNGALHQPSEPRRSGDSLVVDFTYSCDRLTCTFTDTSIGEVTRWRWDLGDGTSAQEAVVVHAYAQEGTYLVTHGINDTVDTKIFIEKYVTVSELGSAPIADFAYTRSDLTASFSDLSNDADGSVVAWNWDYGDGATSTEQHPSHTYAEVAKYYITLTVTDDIGLTGMAVDSVDFATNAPPVAAFTFVTSELTATFTDASVDSDGSVVLWNWDFGDGTSSTEQHPLHTYAESAAYTVTLTVTDDVGLTGTVAEGIDFETNAPPVADFTYVANGLSADFTDASSDSDGSIATWLWEFGDGGTSSMQHPSYSFAGEGTYDVTLTVTDDDGSTANTTQEVSVTTSGSPTNLEDDPLPGSPALLGNFPNPFSVATQIAVDIPAASEVLLEIFDIRGRAVARLADGVVPAGRHDYTWRVDDRPSGVYVVRLTVAAKSTSARLLVVH